MGGHLVYLIQAKFLGWSCPHQQQLDAGWSLCADASFACLTASTAQPWRCFLQSVDCVSGGGGYRCTSRPRAGRQPFSASSFRAWFPGSVCLISRRLVSVLV